MGTDLALWQVLVVLGAIDFLIAMAALFVLTRGLRRFTALRLVVAAALAFPVLFVRTVSCWPERGGDSLRHPLAMLNSMELMSMLYTSVVVVTPVISLVVLLLAIRTHVRARRNERAHVSLPGGRRVGVSGLAWVMLVVGVIGPAGLGVWMTFVEPNWFEVERVGVDIKGQEFDRPVRIAVLSDIQNFEVGAHEARMIELVRAAEPDLIVMPGDLFQMQSSRGDAKRFEDASEEFVRLFRELVSIAPTYFSPGNCEWGYDERSVLRESGVVFLSSRDTALIEIANGRLLLAGTDFAISAKPQWAEPLIEEYASAAESHEAGLVLLSHSPDSVIRLPGNSRFDLTIAGHTHGGQIRVPFFGPIITATEAPREIASGGLNKHNGNTIYVSRGVGVERLGAPRIRLNCRPVIGVIELE
ncbi:MAG: metallophosphoesterase [Planctomycetota bacterium]